MATMMPFALSSHAAMASRDKSGSGKLVPVEFVRKKAVTVMMKRLGDAADVPESAGCRAARESREMRGTGVLPSVPIQKGGEEEEEEEEVKEEDRVVGGSGRRGFMVWSIVLSSISAWAWGSRIAEAAAEDETTDIPLELYRDAKNGFTLLRPTPWNKVDKPGASIFFEDPTSRSNNIGVTVAPVRIASLDGFGTVDDVVKKLVKAERDKPSTKDMQVIKVLEKKVRDNTPLYSLEYTLDTTRGNKRVLTSVTVAAYKLYILSIVFTDSPVARASSALDVSLHQVLDSFELLA